MESAEVPVQSPNNRRRSWVWLVIVAILCVGLFFFVEHTLSSRAAPAAATEPPGVPVASTVARQGDIGVYVEALGTVTPVNTVSVVSRVQGEIMQVSYTEGQMVHKGDPLLQID